MIIEKLIATRRKIFTFLGAYKGDNALLTVNDYNNLVELLNQRGNKTEMVFAVKTNSLDLLSTGGGCLVSPGDECMAGTLPARNYKPANGISSIVKQEVGTYYLTLDKSGLGAVHEVELFFTNAGGIVKVEQDKNDKENDIIALRIYVYNALGELDDTPLANSFAHLVFYNKKLTTITITEE